jgi:hypothetical protein
MVYPNRIISIIMTNETTAATYLLFINACMTVPAVHIAKHEMTTGAAVRKRSHSGRPDILPAEKKKVKQVVYSNGG